MFPSGPEILDTPKEFSYFNWSIILKYSKINYFNISVPRT